MVLSNKKDELIWGDNPNGSYSIALGYKSLWCLREKPPWANAWLPGLIPKINIFYWLALKNKILTQYNLIKRGHVMPNRCPLCKNHLESGNHLFIHCVYSREVWDFLTQDFEIYWCRSNNLLDFFSQWKSLFSSSILQELSTWILPHFF